MDALDLVAKIKMDLKEYEEGLDKASDKAKKSSSSISGAFGKIASGVGTVMKTAVKVTAGAIAGATAGVVALTTQAVKSYAEYEQLTGGIKKLYGNMGMTLDQYADHIGSTAEEAREEWEALDHSQNKVLQNANNAYKTAGLTANQYINSVTGFSSALINSVGKDYEKAGDLADMAMQDIADNANTFGKYTVEELTGVYQALAKGQFMTLDNLNLGYGGSKEGMQQLIDKANELKRANGEMGDLSIEKFSDMVEAIHLVQDDLNITGTTAREASSTIEGSLNMLKASWGNLVTGLADKNADLDGLMQNVVDSIVGYTDDAGKHVNGVADNIIPVVETALKSIATLIQKLVPEALGLIPTLIKEVLPKLTESATTLVQGLVDAITNNMDTIHTVIEQILEAFVKLIPKILELGGKIITTLADALMDNIDTVLEVAGEVLEKLLTGIGDNAQKLASGAVLIITKLVTFLSDNADLLITGAVQLVEGIMTGLMENMDMLLKAGLTLAQAILQGLIDALPQVLEFVTEFLVQIVTMLAENGDLILDTATQMFLGIVKALPEILVALAKALPKIIDAIVDFLTGEGSDEIRESALMMFAEIANAIPEILGTIVGATLEIGTSIFRAIGEMRANMRQNALELFMTITDALIEEGGHILSEIGNTIKGWIDAVKNTVSEWTNAGRALISGLWSGFTEKLASVKDSIVNGAKSIANGVKSALKINSPSKVFAEIGSSMVEGIEYGWDKDIDNAKKNIEKEMDFDVDYSTKYGSTSIVGNAGTGSNSPTHITLYATTTLDGKKVGESTYNYTVDKINGQERALAVATGGYY